ncbi:hypothetical protein [Pedobacter foliorum]|uniref:hypothetical protein n=1 Tax=Pedobacter foliorum TaxID=2739058 RepID=UPI001562F9AB|nr:hypothetical protein [Pedobacter foliorum]NRF38689.1 hypothetical protein [Pedobacter foliorum]
MNNDWLDIAVLEDYLDGKLDAKTMNRVEREALEDPFVAEALAGLSMSPKRSLESLSLLQKQLHDRVAEHNSTKKATVITWQRLSIAATAAVIFISVGIIFWMKQVSYQEMASKRPKKIDINIAPKANDDTAIKSADAIAAVKAKTTEKAVSEVDKGAIGTQAADQVPTEIDKAIKDLKTNAYAANSKARVRSVSAERADARATEAITVSAAPAAVAKEVSDTNANPAEEGKALNEVAVRGFQKQDKKAVVASGNVVPDVPVANVEQLLQGKVAGVNIEAASAPAIGWAEFKAYLEKENRFNKEAKIGKSVELKFTVKNGKPRNITVVNGINEKYNKEAIRLITDGSKWIVPETGNPNVSILIEF